MVNQNCNAREFETEDKTKENEKFLTDKQNATTHQQKEPERERKEIERVCGQSTFKYEEMPLLLFEPKNYPTLNQSQRISRYISSSFFSKEGWLEKVFQDGLQSTRLCGCLDDPQIKIDADLGSRLGFS